MSPTAKYRHGEDHAAQARKEIINGVRPSPLKINRVSHFIRKKPCPSSASNSFIPAANVEDVEPHHHDNQIQPKKKNPIIIYIQSPKVIHTQPRDFMALVQKLTCLSRPKNEESKASGRSLRRSPSSPWEDSIKEPHLLVASNNSDDNATSSVVTDDHEACGKGSVYVQMKPSFDPCFTDMPLFTPNAKDFFPSSRSVHRSTDSSPLGIMSAAAFSPSGFDFFKGFPEY